VIFCNAVAREEGWWIKLRNKKSHNLYSSSDCSRMTKARMIQRAWHVEPMSKMRRTIKFFVREPKWKYTFVRPRFRREENYRMNLKEVVFQGVEWICLSQHMVEFRPLLK
jgi:hypothetical protein